MENYSQPAHQLWIIQLNQLISWSSIYTIVTAARSGRYRINIQSLDLFLSRKKITAEIDSAIIK